MITRVTSGALAVLLIAVLVLRASPERASACSCMGLAGDPTFVQQLFDSSDAVIIGEVLRVDREVLPGDDLDAATKDRRGRISASIRVEQQFKGPGLPQLEVRTAGNGAACGYEGFWAGGWHLMLLNELDGEYNANYCAAFDMAYIDRPEEYERGVRAFIAELERIAPPVAVPTPSPQPHFLKDDFDGDDDGTPIWVWLAVGGGALALIGAVLVIRQRTKIY